MKILIIASKIRERIIKYVEVNNAAGIAKASTILTTNAGTVMSLPITMKVAPVSPKERVKERMNPVNIPPLISGRETFSIALYAVAPSVRAESSYIWISDPSYAAIIDSTITGTEKTICVKMINHIPEPTMFRPLDPQSRRTDKPRDDVGIIIGTLSKVLM